MQKDSLYWEKNSNRRNFPKIANRALNMSVDWNRTETIRSEQQTFRARSFMASKKSPRVLRSPIEKPRHSYIINHEKLVRDSYKEYRFKDYIKDIEKTQALPVT